MGLHGAFLLSFARSLFLLCCPIAEERSLTSAAAILFPLALAENEESFVDKNSDEPASKRTIIFNVWRIPRCRPPAVLHRKRCPFLIANYPARDKVK
jgi:hypothetical protein